MENPEGETESILKEDPQPLNNVDGKHTPAPEEESAKELDNDKTTNNVSQEQETPESMETEESQENEPSHPSAENEPMEEVPDEGGPSVNDDHHQTVSDAEMREESEDTQGTQDEVQDSEEVNVAEGIPQTEEEKEEQLRQLCEDDPFASAEHAEESSSEPKDTLESTESERHSPSRLDAEKFGPDDSHNDDEVTEEAAQNAEEEKDKEKEDSSAAVDLPESDEENTESAEPSERREENEEENTEPAETDSQEKNQSVDLFDSLRDSRDDSQTPSSAREKPSDNSDPQESTAQATSDDEDDHHADDSGDVNMDEDQPEDRPEGEDDIAMDDAVEEEAVDEGGADEEVCLIPDEEREISEAEREALLAEQAAASKESESAGDGGDDDVEITEEHRSPADDDDAPSREDAADGTQEEDTDVTMNDTTIQQDRSSEQAADSSSSGNVIVEESQPSKDPVECFQCKKSVICIFSLQQEGQAVKLCTEECVNEFKKANPDTEYTLRLQKLSIYIILETGKSCVICETIKLCKYRFKKTAISAYSYLCDEPCLNSLLLSAQQGCMVIRRKYLIEEAPASDQEVSKKCYQCTDDKICKFIFRQDEDEFFLCQEDCVNLLLLEQPDRFRLRRRTVRVRDLPKESGGSATVISQENSSSAAASAAGATTSSAADVETFGPDSSQLVARTPEEVEQARIEREQSFLRVCVQCFNQITPNEKSIIWETMDYCNEVCLQTYQTLMLSTCSLCGVSTPATSVGKYCVRFGYQIRQFCQTSCLAVFKKGLKMCSFCHENMVDKTGILAAIGPTQFKDFCSNECKDGFLTVVMGKKRHVVADCGVCRNKKPVRKEVIMDDITFKLCCNACFSAFSFVNNLTADQCKLCSKYFERKSTTSFTIYDDFTPNIFCSKICFNLFIVQTRKIVPCAWCKVKKYNFDMLRRGSGAKSKLFCSTSCLSMFDMPKLSTIQRKPNICDNCCSKTPPQYHLQMSDQTSRNFCTYQCVMAFQGQFSKRSLNAPLPEDGTPIPVGPPKRLKTAPAPKLQSAASSAAGKTASSANRPAVKTVQVSAQKSSQQTVPVISKVTSLSPMATRGRGRPKSANAAANASANTNDVSDLSRFMDAQPRVVLQPLQRTELSQLRPPSPQKDQRRSAPIMRVSSSSKAVQTLAQPPPSPRVEHKTQVVTVAPPPKPVANMSTMCKPLHVSKGVTCRAKTEEVDCQTDAHLQRKIVIPIPVPIYVPAPMHMYSMPIPVPVPIPIPIPIPIFIPTTRNSAPGIMKEIKKIQDKMPTDPFEAELLMMAEMVAGDKKKAESDSDSDADEEDTSFPAETIETGNAFGEDMLQMALKMATEYEEPAVDLESAMTANTITPGAPGHPHLGDTVIEQHNTLHQHHMMLMEQQSRQAEVATVSGRGRKRGSLTTSRQTRSAPVKRPRRNEVVPTTPPQPEPPREPAEKPDANMCLKYTFGVNAWKQWVMSKNADLEKSTLRRKPFKSDLLQLTADELNYSLCLFVKEVRKPNGSEYAPDTIYYLVLGIQQYLYENNRIDNIFTDPYYEKFTDCLDEVARKFSVLYNDSQYIVTRVEEEHLWECKQLGAHSPHVLLSTLMFFNTKHFNLTTVDEHMELSFSHIMKHWKRNPNSPGAAKLPGSRNVLLRFYPPQANDGTNRKKRVYEQQENEANPLRCPVKLYEFYLSKCPESVKTRNDIFYLQPERSCVPDSPVWYSTQALGREALSKMLHRVKMVKEINIALLTS